MRKEIQQFAQAMEARAAVHDEDRGDKWRLASVNWLLDRASDEFGECRDAFDDCDPEAVMNELIDAANFLMFAYSKLADMRATPKDRQPVDRAAESQANLLG